MHIVVSADAVVSCAAKSGPSMWSTTSRSDRRSPCLVCLHRETREEILIGSVTVAAGSAAWSVRRKRTRARRLRQRRTPGSASTLSSTVARSRYTATFPRPVSKPVEYAQRHDEGHELLGSIGIYGLGPRQHRIPDDRLHACKIPRRKAVLKSGVSHAAMLSVIRKVQQQDHAREVPVDHVPTPTLRKVICRVEEYKPDWRPPQSGRPVGGCGARPR